MQNSKGLTDEEINQNFRSMLKIFKDIVETVPPPAIDKVRDELEELQKEAMNSCLTSRQISAIYERCANYLNGSYGQNLSVCK